jgi:hypothetical protein
MRLLLRVSVAALSLPDPATVFMLRIQSPNQLR